MLHADLLNIKSKAASFKLCDFNGLNLQIHLKGESGYVSLIINVTNGVKQPFSMCCFLMRTGNVEH